MVPEPSRQPSPVLDLIHLHPDEAPPVAPTHDAITADLVDALDLAVSPLNLLAVQWSLVRGEFDGLRVERPVRMAHTVTQTWL